jgi:prephenate dehydrogenase
MYRQYENPYVIEQYLKEARERLNKAKAEVRNEDDWDRLTDYYQDVAELEERLNFAWQDDEAAEFGYD